MNFKDAERIYGEGDPKWLKPAFRTPLIRDYASWCFAVGILNGLGLLDNINNKAEFDRRIKQLKDGG